MLCRADSIGVFQVESRAQIGTLPRLKPRSFYDLAIEIALIRPGPIQGGAVHPYIRRATGKEPVTYDHPSLEPVLGRTLGVPLFQEQLMAMAVTLGDCSRDDADLLRRAMGSKRGVERIEKVKEKLYAGMARRGITGDQADGIYVKILSFANFGFAESHALSFALLVYASSWFKLHYPAGVPRRAPAQPADGLLLAAVTGGRCQEARRVVLRPDIQLSGAQAGLELSEPADDRLRYDGALAVRLGLDSVRGIGTELAERIVAEREATPYSDITDLSRKSGADLCAARGAGHRGCVRRVRARSAAGAVDVRLRRVRRPAARQHSGAATADAAGDERGGAHPRRPLGDEDLAGAAPDRAPPGRPRRGGDPPHHRTLADRTRVAGSGSPA